MTVRKVSATESVRVRVKVRVRARDSLFPGSFRVLGREISSVKKLCSDKKAVSNRLSLCLLFSVYNISCNIQCDCRVI